MTILEQLTLPGVEHVKFLQDLSDQELENQSVRWQHVQLILEARAAITPDSIEDQLDTVVEMLFHAAPEHEEQIRDAHKAVCEQVGFEYPE